MRFYRVQSVVHRDPATGAWVTDNSPPTSTARRMWVQWPNFDHSPPGLAYVTWVDEDA